MNFAFFSFNSFGYGSDGGGSGARNYFYAQNGSGNQEQILTSDGHEIIVKRG